MPRTKGPGLAIDAAGSVGRVLIQSHWKGNPYVKRYVKPFDARTQLQLANRAATKWLINLWRTLTTAQQATWLLHPKSKTLPPYQTFLSENLRRWGALHYPSFTYPCNQLAPTGTYNNTLTTPLRLALDFQLDRGGAPSFDYWALHIGTSASFTATRKTLIGFHKDTQRYMTLTATNLLPTVNYWFLFYTCGYDGSSRKRSYNGPFQPFP